MLDLIALLIFTFVAVLLDGFLTGVSYRCYTKYAKNHLEIEAFELNPRWQESYGKGRLFDPKILFYLVNLLLLEGIIWYFSSMVFVFVSGFVVFLELFLNLNHVNNFFLFKKYSKSIQGKAKFLKELSHLAAFAKAITSAPLLLVAFFVTNSLFILGGFAGLVVLSFTYLKWGR